LFSDPIPIPAKAIAGEPGGIATKPNVDVSSVANKIIDAVRNDHSTGPTGKVMVKSLKCTLRPHATFAVQLAEELFGFRINGKHRVSRIEVLVLKFVDSVKLRVTIRRTSARNVLPDLVEC
jgi:hypothetical protein